MVHDYMTGLLPNPDENEVLTPYSNMSMSPGMGAMQAQTNTMARLNEFQAHKAIEFQADVARKCLKLQTTEEELNIRDRHLENRKNRYIRVVQTEDGSLYLENVGSDAKARSMVAAVISGTDFKSSRYFSCYPKKKSVLEITWRNAGALSEKKRCVFKLGQPMITTSQFISNLKAAGLFLSFPPRYQKASSEKLMDFFCASAREIEIPVSYGWVKMADSEWHYVNEGPTMEDFEDELEW